MLVGGSLWVLFDGHWSLWVVIVCVPQCSFMGSCGWSYVVVGRHCGCGWLLSVFVAVHVHRLLPSVGTGHGGGCGR